MMSGSKRSQWSKGAAREQWIELFRVAGAMPWEWSSEFNFS